MTGGATASSVGQVLAYPLLLQSDLRSSVDAARIDVQHSTIFLENLDWLHFRKLMKSNQRKNVLFWTVCIAAIKVKHLPEQVVGNKHVSVGAIQCTATLFTSRPLWVNRSPGPSRMQATVPATKTKQKNKRKKKTTHIRFLSIFLSKRKFEGLYLPRYWMEFYFMGLIL